VIAKGLDHPQGSHRVHIEYMGPGFVVDIAGLLPRRWLGLRIPVAIVTVADRPVTSVAGQRCVLILKGKFPAGPCLITIGAEECPSQLQREPYDPIGGSLASGKLKPIIAKTFPIKKIVDAHRFMESKR
jgi:Zinc-binding dehydrogenase